MTANEGERPRWDFFVSYTQADRSWAEWIAWVLEEAGYRVLIQAWDFVPGSNWVSGMQAGTRDATRTVAVLSEAYLGSVYSSAEWQAALTRDPAGTSRKLLVVRVAACQPVGLLASVVRVDLFGIDESTARTRIRDMVAAALAGRAKPAVAPRFPGSSRAIQREPQFPGGSPAVSEPRPALSSSRQAEVGRPAGTEHIAKLPRTGTAVHCPFCFSRFFTSQIQFRCTAERNWLDKRCIPIVDEVMLARTGYDAPEGPVFVADGTASKAECPACKSDTTVRVCPVCHETLPVDFGNVSTRLIALVGGRESGKTVFMTVLLNELMNRVGSQFDAAIACANERTWERYARSYARPLYYERRFRDGTPGLFPREPLVFRFTTERNRRIGASKPRHTLLSFVDTVGENLTIQRSGYEYARYLTAADGIVLLLDPLQMRGIRAHVKPGTRLPDLDAAADDSARILERITDVVMAGGDRRAKKATKPLAIAFTKMDALIQNLKETSPLRRPQPQTPFFDDKDSKEVHAEIQQLLVRWEGPRIDQITSKHYQRYRYFGLSALGETPTPDNRVPERGIHPYRVTDPFFWMLAQFGAIRTKS